MSYGSIGKQATQYLEIQVLAATPGELMIMVYDHLLVQLLKAQRAHTSPELTIRCDALEKARAALGELQVTLDHDKGGPLAAQLASIYTFLLGELTTLGLRPEARRFEGIVRIVSELRGAFAQAAATTALATHAVPA